MELTLQQAQSKLAELPAHVAAGEEVIFTDNEQHKPFAELIEGCSPGD